MLLKVVDDEVIFEPPAFRDVLDEFSQVAVEDRKPRQTGPRTEAGKDAAKRNSTRHGLTGKGNVLTPEVQAEADAMIDQLTAKYQPRCEEDHRLIRDAAIAYARQYEAIRQQTLLLTLRSEQAAADWDCLRAIEIQETAAKLQKSPGLTAAKLQSSTPGTVWMIEQWKHLYKTLKDRGDWTANEQAVAQDLLGLMPRLRETDSDGVQHGTLEERKKLVKKEVRFLRELVSIGRDSCERLERQMVMEGFIPAAGPEYRRLKRYEREARNGCERAIQALEARRLERIREEAEDDDFPPLPPIVARSAAPRPPKPLLTQDDVLDAITGPNPPARLMARLEKEAAEPLSQRLARTKSAEAPPSLVEEEPKPRPKAPRDHELDAEALQRREARRNRRKNKKRGR